MRRKIPFNALLYIAIVLSLGAGFRERRSLVRALSEVSALQERTQHLAVFQSALLKYLNRAELGRPFLVADAGVGIASEEVFDLAPSSVLLYFLATDCPICPSNYGFLNELAESGVPVFGVVFDPAEGAVKRHHAEWDVRFPILVDPHGSAVEVIPRYGTPTVIAISEEQVVFLEFGELSLEAQDFLRSSSLSWVEADTAPPG